VDSGTPQHITQGLKVASYLATFCSLVLALLVGCRAPEPMLRFPTRVPSTPTTTPFPFSARSYYEMGVARQNTGDLNGALEAYKWAVRRSPDFARAHVAEGTVYMARGDVVQALIQAAKALQVDPECAEAHALRGEVARRQGHYWVSLGAFNDAIAIDPELASETFHGRWLAAVALDDSSQLQELAWEYGSAHPGDELTSYYSGWALVERDMSQAAIRLLVSKMGEAEDPPAILWFTLGEAYVSNGSWLEAVTSLEVVRELTFAGDTSLTNHSDTPLITLSDALGRAYLGAGRCVDAETMLDYAVAIGAPASRYTRLLSEARICQTPTPTASPYPTTTPTRP